MDRGEAGGLDTGADPNARVLATGAEIGDDSEPGLATVAAGLGAAAGGLETGADPETRGAGTEAPPQSAVPGLGGGGGVNPSDVAVDGSLACCSSMAPPDRRCRR
ncbi:hypothetical protein [Actinoplanes sp. NPDC051851]|uniref:hypothetical protein n=1 Tax=Actinoplanes sp. NPDC051851 TaxID=3154753 RepID=UPI003422B1CE